MSNRSKALVLLSVAIIALIGFRAGFSVGLQMKTASTAQERAQELTQPGSANAEVRAAVIRNLQAFGEGYRNRDPKSIGTFARQMFPTDGDVLILGTEGGAEEWVRGAPAARHFIEEDWRYWGDVSLATDQAIVWSSGDVAWTATLGTVRFKRQERPIRVTAILVREEDRWVFRQIHFQWDDAPASASDLLDAHAWAHLWRGVGR